jgi:hypothetical protein
LHGLDPVQRARFTVVEVRLARCWGFCPTLSPADKCSRALETTILCLSHTSLVAQATWPIPTHPYCSPDDRRPTTTYELPCRRSIEPDHPRIRRQIPHRLHQHITCSPNTACCSREQTPTTSRPGLPCSYHHRHITAPQANRHTPTDVHKHPPAHVRIRLGTAVQGTTPQRSTRIRTVNMDLKLKTSTLRPKQNPEILPASQYLQDRLQERRARNPRPKRTRQSDLGPRMPAGHDDDLFFAEGEDSRHAFARSYDSSPLAPMSRYGSDNVSNGNSGATLSAGGRKRRTPGARELDEQMDRLMKQNFDLKLELDHRRENQAKLHADIESMRAAVERAQRLEEEHEELMRINSLLVEELEKRDKAIQEAADIICELEEKVEDYEESRATETRPSTAHADSGYAGTETQEQMPLSSPPEVIINSRPPPQNPAAATSASNRLNSAVQHQTPVKPRVPSFMTSQKPSTNALRTVYLDAGKDLHPVKSFNSILSKRASTVDEDSMTDDIPASLHLSVLSESSFPSIYGGKGDTPEKYDWEDLPESTMPYGSAHSRQDSISRVNQWIEDRDLLAETPSKSNHVSPMVSTASMAPSPHLSRRSAEPSILSLSSAAASARSDLLDTPTLVKPFPVLGGDRTKNAPKTPLATGFGDPMLPTPESGSTRMLRSSRSSVVGERSLLDVTPAQVKSFAPLQPRPSAAPNHTQPDSASISNANQRTDEHSNARTALKRAAIDDTTSESDDEEYHAPSDNLDFDYPDGNSITNGTPSRFLKPNKQPSATADVFFNNTDLSPPARFTPAVRSPQRRKSSAEVAYATPSKPALYRSGTSPNVYGTATSSSHGRPMTSDSTSSPRSYYSASSSIRPTPRNRHARSLSPEPAQQIPRPATAGNVTTPTPSPPKFRPQPAPTSATRSSFTQKTQSLFRRLSNTNSTTSTTNAESARREREVSPLPTLTSTPSAAYHPQREREVRRPSASRSGSVRATSRDGRPALSPRTKTEPMASPSDTSESLGGPKRGLFRRGGSFRQAADVSSVRSAKR